METESNNMEHTMTEQAETAEPEEETTDASLWDEEEDEEPTDTSQEDTNTPSETEEDEGEPSATPQEKSPLVEKVTPASLEQANEEIGIIGVTRKNQRPVSLLTSHTHFKTFSSKEQYFEQQMEQRMRALDLKLRERTAFNLQQRIMEQALHSQAQRDLTRLKSLSEVERYSSFGSNRSTKDSMGDGQIATEGWHGYYRGSESEVEERFERDGEIGVDVEHRRAINKDMLVQRQGGTEEMKDMEALEALSQSSSTSISHWQHEDGDVKKIQRRLSFGEWFKNLFRKKKTD